MLNVKARRLTEREVAVQDAALARELDTYDNEFHAEEKAEFYASFHDAVQGVYDRRSERDQ